MSAFVQSFYRISKEHRKAIISNWPMHDVTSEQVFPLGDVDRPSNSCYLTERWNRETQQQRKGTVKRHAMTSQSVQLETTSVKIVYIRFNYIKIIFTNPVYEEFSRL